MRAEREVTISPREMTATSEVPPPDIDDHAACCFAHGKAGADRRGHRLIDQADVFRACAAGRVMHGALFHLGYAGGDTDHYAGTVEGGTARCTADKFLEHIGSNVKIRNYAVLRGRTAIMDRGYGRSFFCFNTTATTRFGLERTLPQPRRLAGDNPFTFYEYECVCSAKVNADIL